MPSTRPDNIFLQQKLERLISQAVATIFKFGPFYAMAKFLINGQSLQATLECLAALWAIRYHNAVQNELRLLNESFAGDRLPHYFAELSSPATIRWINMAFVIGFFGLFFSSVYPLLFCFVGLLISALDQAGTAFVIINYGRFCHEDRKFAPVGKDKRRITRHRNILDQYYLQNPLIGRTIIIIFAWSICIVLLISSMTPEQLCKAFDLARCEVLLRASPYLYHAGIGFAIAVIPIAETSIFLFRIPRNRQLKKLYGINYYFDADIQRSRLRREGSAKGLRSSMKKLVFWFRKLMFDIKAS